MGTVFQKKSSGIVSVFCPKPRPAMVFHPETRSVTKFQGEPGLELEHRSIKLAWITSSGSKPLIASAASVEGSVNVKVFEMSVSLRENGGMT
jgi:hypothetical protein